MRTKQGIFGVGISPASAAERAFFADHCACVWGCEVEELPEFWLGIIPNYTTDGPGYSGIVYVAIWAGAPEYVTIATRTDDKMRIVHNNGA